MQLIYKTKQLILAAGDLISFIIGFLLSLTIRFFELPTIETIEKNLNLFIHPLNLHSRMNFVTFNLNHLPFHIIPL